MKVYTLLCFCMLASTFWVEAGYEPAYDLEDLSYNVETSIYGDIDTIAHPIDSFVLTTATSDCEALKELFQITYEQLDDNREPDLNELTIIFKTKEGQAVYNINEAAKALSKNPNFDKTHKLVFYLHGFNPSKISFRTVSEASVAKGGYTVLALNASKLIGWLYLRATTYVRFIGNKIGEILAELSKEGISAERITIVGHSLGAHIGSFASKKYRNLTGKLIERLTGLDPAGPCFENLDDDLRLKKTDAKYVDVIHTDAGVYGTTESLGHADYFPNGGFNQPDCLLQTSSHSRAWEFYASSVIYTDLFPAVKCKSWDHFKGNRCNDSDTSYMGYASAPESSGNYYLVTAGFFPYGLGKEGLKYTGGNGVLSNIDYDVRELFDDGEEDDVN